MAITYFSFDDVDCGNKQTVTFKDLQSFAEVFNLHIDEVRGEHKKGLWWVTHKWDPKTATTKIDHCIFDISKKKVWVISLDDRNTDVSLKTADVEVVTMRPTAKLEVFANRQWYRLTGEYKPW